MTQELRLEAVTRGFGYGAGDGSWTHLSAVEEPHNSRYTTPAYKVASSFFSMHAPSLSIPFCSPGQGLALNALTTLKTSSMQAQICGNLLS